MFWVPIGVWRVTVERPFEAMVKFPESGWPKVMPPVLFTSMMPLSLLAPSAVNCAMESSSPFVVTPVKLRP